MPEDEKMPRIVVLPECQAEMDKHPELAGAIQGIKESMLNAMQGVKDGRYKTFDDAMEAMTGERPKPVEPPNPPEYGYFLSVGPDPKGDGVLAVISDGHPKRGHKRVKIEDVERFRTKEEAEAWFKARCVALPYEKPDEDDTNSTDV